ncbi:amino acid deaminase [Zobellella iuensis]|uniref:Amino acid deaminase n=1 Tax=Zobellella iuensis TaxID=2803811 RepID=A0ABS1QLT8_9GAMM|nr:amino acid deaminase [Zobellella iuensis]MBL1375835.1 amino acid deaminase [Zobellella iuensis]
MKYQDERLGRHKGGVPCARGDGGYQVLEEDACLPLAMIKLSALEQNLAWMQRFMASQGMAFAPHGKTTMSPDLFRRQLAAGAWGMTVATPQQAWVAREAGAERILMANQLVGKANMALVAELLETGVDFYCCVDSAANAVRLSEFFAGRGQRLRVLVELGVPGGRCGCRSLDDAKALSERILALPGLELAGVEFYEGVIGGEQAEPRILALVAEAVGLLGYQAERSPRPLLITGAGSAWYDLVAKGLDAAKLPAGALPLLRPGCYLTHDLGIYAEAQQGVMARSPAACELGGDLVSALELAAYVQSLPEPGQAVLGFGKRDVAFDAGLPVPLAHYRDGRRLGEALAGWRVEKVMDQHAFMTLPADTEVQVGDVVLFGTSHPCLTFDKWRRLALVDDDYRILESIETRF